MSSSVVFQQFYPSLVQILPMNDDTFLANVFSAKLLPGNIKEQVQLQGTRTAKATLLLDHVIRPSVVTGVGRSFNDPVEVMEASELAQVKELAQQIKIRLGVGTEPREEAIDPSAACEKVRKHYPRILKLNISVILGQLYADEVITIEQKMEIDVKPLEANKMEHFLDHMLIPSLQAGYTEKYTGFISVLKGGKDSDMKQMAEKIG